MAEELKACPFCGEAARLLTDITVECSSCAAGGRTLYRDWQTRPVEDALRAEVEQLKADQKQSGIDYCQLRDLADERLVEVEQLTAELARYKEPLTDERAVYGDKALLRDALHHWGLPSQTAMVAEEAAELAVAAMHMLRDQHHNKSGAPDDFCSEMADVEIMIDQMKVAGYADKIAEFKASKMLRLGVRLDAAIRAAREGAGK